MKLEYVTIAPEIDNLYFKATDLAALLRLIANALEDDNHSSNVSRITWQGTVIKFYPADYPDAAQWLQENTQLTAKSPADVSIIQ